MANLFFLLPGLPGDDGRLSWNRLEVEYVRGRSLSGYLAADLFLEPSQVHHVIIAGRVIRPEDFVTVEVPETAWQRRWRKLWRKPAPTVEVSAFDAYLPARGVEIAVVPCVDGKNSSVILGVVGAIIGFYVGGPGGVGPGWTWGAALSGAMTGYAIGSTVGALITPKPRLIRDEDGPSSYVWGGTANDDRAGVPKPILCGERLVGGKRIGMVRRRSGVVPVRTAAPDYNDSSPANSSESLSLLLLVAAHQCQGPVGITNPVLPAHATTNQPDVRINGTHYSNFTNTRVEWRTGLPGQSVIKGFDVAANTYDLAVELTTPGYTYTTVDEVDAIEVLLNLPGLFHTHDEKGVQPNTTRYKLEYRQVGSGTWHNADYDPGDGAFRRLTAHTTALRLETRRIDKLPNGSDLPRDRYDIRLSFISAEFIDPDKDAWKIFLTGITEEVQESRNYEGESLLAVTGLATEQLNGPVPTVTSVWRGYIPSKYVTGAGWSAPDWGVGSFAPAGKNPFWLSLALMRDTRIGAGNEITDAEINLASFESAAPEADTSEDVVPVGGTPYTEPRHQFCAYIDQDQESVDLIQQIVSTARAVLIFSGNQWSVAVDRPGTISQVFGMGSMRLASDDPDAESTFNLQFKSERHEVNSREATFDDAAADWETDSHTEAIDNRNPISVIGTSSVGSPIITGIASTADIVVGVKVTVSAAFAGIREVLGKTSSTITLDTNATAATSVTVSVGGVFVSEDDLVALSLPVLRRKVQFWGVDRRTQAARELRFMLRQDYALRELGSFGAYTEALLAQVYDLIGISHDVPQWSYSGRVFESPIDPSLPEALSTVMFNQPVPWDDSTPYEVKVRFRDPGPDGKDFIETRDVADTAPSEIQGEYIGLSVTSPFSRIPQAGDEWFYGPSGQAVRPVRIVDIDRDADDQRTIQFAEYNASIYDVSGPIVIPQYSLLPDFAAPPGAIPDLKATADIVQMSDGRRITNILLQWSRPNPTRTSGPYKGAKLEYSFDDEHWNPLISVDGLEHRWIDAPHGIHIWFRAIPYSISGRYNLAGAAYADITPEGYGEPSPVITALTGGYADGAFWLSWGALGPEYEYEVRQASNPDNWATDATGYLWRGKTLRFLDESPDARNITYYVRARDPFGNYSLAAVAFAVNDTAPAAPTIDTITRFKDGFKIRATPPGSTLDIVAIHLHASQSAGFTPSAANRVGSPLGPKGGEFLFKTAVTGVWYFKATCEDWLSERMNDWVYSSQDDDDIIVVAPVDPAAVDLTFTGTDGKVVERVNGTFRTRAISIANTTWTHSDAVNPANSLQGWQIVLYDSVDGITKPLRDSGVLADPSLRAYYFPNVSEINSPTVIAAVKAIYVDGVTSDYVTSTGETIPQSTNPHIRDSDDRFVAPYAESFDGASLPDAVSVVGGTYSLASPAGELKVTRNASFNYVAWDFTIWAAAHLDTLREGTVNAIVGLKIDTPSLLTGPVYLRGNGGNNVAIEVELEIVNDGAFHAYSVPWGSITLSGGYYPRLSVDMSSSGLPQTGSTGVWRLRDIALAHQGVDSSWDGNVDRGEQARRNFDRDPDGDGMRMISPVRMGDAEGNYTVVWENGIYFLRNAAGEIITEASYKSAKQGRLETFAAGGSILFDDDTDANWGITIAVPKPASFNKFRVVVQDVGSDALPATAPPSTTIRRWMEACNFSFSPTPFWQVMAYFFYGGTLQRHRAAGPWSPTNQAKSALTLSTTNGDTTDPSADAWYYVQDDGLPIDDIAPTFHFYFRIVVWLAITMPDVKRANGSYYYADFDFSVRVGKATLAGSQMDLTAGEFVKRGPSRIRLLSDNRTQYIPIVIGNGGPGLWSRDQQNIKVDWHGLTWEAGGAGTPGCEIYEIHWSYINSATDYQSLSSTSVGFIALEEYGG